MLNSLKIWFEGTCKSVAFPQFAVSDIHVYVILCVTCDSFCPTRPVHLGYWMVYFIVQFTVAAEISILSRYLDIAYPMTQPTSINLCPCR